MALIKNKKDYRAFMRKRDRIYKRAVKEAALFSWTELVEILRATDTYGDVSENLRASSGHPGPVSAPADPTQEIPFGAPPMAAAWVPNPDKFSGTLWLHIGMEYAPIVDAYWDFTREARDQARPTIDRNMAQSWAAADREVERIG